MMKLKHTPGKWHDSFPEESNGFYHIDTGECMCGQIATIWSNENDARLIATAPEMLKFIIKKYETIRNDYRDIVKDEYQQKIIKDELKLYEEIIERATGLSIDEVLKCEK